MASITQKITIENYSDKSFVVRGDTKPVKEEMKSMGGKWNPNLKGGTGWIFSNKCRTQVEEWLTNRYPAETEEEEEYEEDYDMKEYDSDEEEWCRFKGEMRKVR